MRLHAVASACLCLTVGAASFGCRHRAAPTQTNGASESMLTERLARAEKSLVELDVTGVRAALDAIVERHVEVDLLRARLALAVGDCQGAVATLSALAAEAQSTRAQTSSPTSPAIVPAAGSPRTEYPSELYAVADGCARAMAGAAIAVDDARGVWVRFQNSHDRVLLPLIADAADRAAKAIGADLGTTLPRPLRIELVSDLVSLAAVTGLPLEAAETTGTIAIARWGKVTLVSPRATPDGYPWQDTLAHELAHLVVARQSGDFAPLWLQEGVAKREETRWRESRPLDAADASHREARRALFEGRSVGIDRLGASIALLPTPQAAETAYAEVRDFLDYWIENNGEKALVLLLRDLAGLGSKDADRALMSVSGYTLGQWNLRWQHSLFAETAMVHPEPAGVRSDQPTNGDGFDLPALRWGVDAARRLRLAELLEERRHFRLAAEQLAPFNDTPKLPPELAHRSALSQLLLGHLDVAHRLVEPERVSHLDGTWLAVRGRVLATMGDAGAAEVALLQGLAFAPTLEKVACRGFSVSESEPPMIGIDTPEHEPWRSLCQAARSP
jgi:hypothetical protein